MEPGPEEMHDGRGAAPPRQGLCVASVEGRIRHFDRGFHDLCGFPSDAEEGATAHLDRLLPGWQRGVDHQPQALELLRGDGQRLPVWWAATSWGDELAGTLRPRGRQHAAATPTSLAASTIEISHDLRIPLTGLINSLQLSLSETDLEAARQQVVVAYQSATFLHELLDGLLDVGRLAGGRSRLRRQAFSVQRLVHAVADTFRPAAEAKQLQLSAALGGGVPAEVVGDPIRIQRVLHNLVHNAVKFTDRGKVEVTVTAAGRTSRSATLIFRVHDTGPGLSRTQRGGLGLTIARELVAALGGSLSIRRNSRQGTHLQFTVPVRIALRSPETAEPPQAPPPPHPPLRCLVVEDTPSNALVLQGLLGRMGHEVTHVATSREAQRQCRENAYDVALVDLGLPDGEGTDLVDVLRESGKIPYCIAVTAHVLPEFRARCLDAGFDGLMVKPIDYRDLGWQMHAAATMVAPEGPEAEPSPSSNVPSNPQDASQQSETSEPPQHLPPETL